MFGYVNRKRNQKGFTLMEMLIVVAIIAILVAVSIPIFTSQLEKSREATDAANFRAAKAEVVAYYLDDQMSTLTTETHFYYDAENGKLVTTAPTVGYGKGTTSGDDGAVYKDRIIFASYTPGGATDDDKIVMGWTAAASTTPTAVSTEKLYQEINLESIS